MSFVIVRKISGQGNLALFIQTESYLLSKLPSSHKLTGDFPKTVRLGAHRAWVERKNSWEFVQTARNRGTANANVTFGRLW